MVVGDDVSEKCVQNFKQIFLFLVGKSNGITISTIIRFLTKIYDKYRKKTTTTEKKMCTFHPQKVSLLHPLFPCHCVK